MNPTFNVYTIMYTELPSSPNNLGGCSTIIKIINLSGKPTLLDKHLYIFFFDKMILIERLFSLTTDFKIVLL